MVGEAGDLGGSGRGTVTMQQQEELEQPAAGDQ
jgi:hypothetical protein